MKNSMKKMLLSLLCVAAGISILPGAIAGRAGQSDTEDKNVQTIEVTAKKYEFSPSPIRVKAGTRVQLKITAVDHDHGFKIATVAEGSQDGGAPGLILTPGQDCLVVKKGTTETVEFVAQKPGRYAFRCCHVCGFGHRGMKGELVVE